MSSKHLEFLSNHAVHHIHADAGMIPYHFFRLGVQLISQHTNISTVSLGTTQLRPLILKRAAKVYWLPGNRGKDGYLFHWPCYTKKHFEHGYIPLFIKLSCFGRTSLTTNRQNTVTLKGTFKIQICFYSQSHCWCTELFKILYAYFTVLLVSHDSLSTCSIGPYSLVVVQYLEELSHSDYLPAIW